MKLNINVENINYIKIMYKDRDNFTHCIKAAIKLFDEREIIASAKFDEGLFISTPQNILLSIACDNGLYKASTELKYIVKEEPYIIFTIETPQEIDYQQKREYFRVKIDENALVSYITDNEEKRDVSCETYDLSANGVRLVLDKSVNFPDIVHLTLYLPRKVVETDAKFIRTDDEDNILKASFRFIDLKETDLDCISQTCFQKQLETRRKSLM